MAEDDVIITSLLTDDVMITSSLTSSWILMVLGSLGSGQNAAVIIVLYLSNRQLSREDLAW